MIEFEIILKLTSNELLETEKNRTIRDFAKLLGWEPSEIIKVSPKLESVTNGHILVEHGLLQSAVITFLTKPYSSLEEETRNEILSISYNNLIDWHINIEQDKATFVFNRNENQKPIIRSISQKDVSNLRSSMFAQITDLGLNPNFPALDELLINNISYWKRNLAAELNNKPKLDEFSTLFNTLIFIRAAEDHQKRITNKKTNILLDNWERISKNKTLYKILRDSVNTFVQGAISKFLNLDKIKSFDNLNDNVTYNLLASFYKSKQIPYEYDFAIISKHALSRIYEHYVSLLRFEEHSQLSLFTEIPIEEINKTYGSIYTPQFIARFFSRYLVERTPPGILKKMKILDPACGSGIFLRTILEFLCNPNYEVFSTEEIDNIFANVSGFDIDPNAVEATKLSLALLYLVLINGQIPSKLNIMENNSLEYFYKNKRTNFYDVIFANPPYISFDHLTDQMKESVQAFLEDKNLKKPDSYLAFLKLSIEIMRPGGLGFFVIPHAFLRTNSASKIRSLLTEESWIISLIDLSNIPVFEDKGSYVILLIIQKKLHEATEKAPNANIVLCRDFVGHALQDLIFNRKTQNDFYKIFELPQELFKENDWSNAIITPEELSLKRKLDKFVPLSEIFEVKQGIITGGDNVFIVSQNKIPKGEEKIWRPLLKDRDIPRYEFPGNTNYYVFYPIINGSKITQAQLRKIYPKTWEYLKKHKNNLTQRKLSDRIWWMPVSLRSEDTLFIPKIITPHLVLIPRFSLDNKGEFAVSRTPYLVPKVFNGDYSILYFILGILNSIVGSWLISTHSDKYSRGYARLEVKTLKTLTIPDPSKIDKAKFNSFINAVKLKIDNPKDLNLEKDIDKIAMKIYGLNEGEKKLIGFEGYGV